MRFILILILLNNLNCFGQTKLGKSDIVKLTHYEKEDEYFPHDCSMESAILKKAIELDKKEKHFIIKNIANNGFTGHSIEIRLNTELEIEDADYNEWTDILDGSTTTFKIDKVELKLNSNPFKKTNFIGYYTIYMTGHYKAGEILSKEGVKDEVFSREFKGKFNTNCNR